MSKSDKTKPLKFRLKEAGATKVREYRGYPIFDNIPRHFKYSYAERGYGPKHVRYSKRMKAKKNRRRKQPWTQMRGHGWGEENMRYWNG